MKKSIIVFLFVGFLLFMVVRSYLLTQEVMRTTFHIIIDDIDTTAKGNLLIYYDGHRTHFSGYTLTKFDSILIGDSISKDSCDKFLYVYRENSNGSFGLILKLEPNTWIPIDWFCN